MENESIKYTKWNEEALLTFSSQTKEASFLEK